MSLIFKNIYSLFFYFEQSLFYPRDPFDQIYKEYLYLSPGRKSYRKHVSLLSQGIQNKSSQFMPQIIPSFTQHIIANTRNTIETIIHDLDPIHPPNLAWNFTRVNGGGGRGTKANSRLLSSTGEQRVDQRIAEHEPDGGQPRVLDSSRPHSSIGTTPFPRRDFNYHLSVHVAQDQGRQGAREGGNRDVGREQSTTGAGTAQIRFNDRCPTRFDLDLLFISDLTIVQSRYLATFACLTRNESQTKASRDHFATDRIVACRIMQG